MENDDDHDSNKSMFASRLTTNTWSFRLRGWAERMGVPTRRTFRPIRQYTTKKEQKEHNEEPSHAITQNTDDPNFPPDIQTT